MIYIPEHDMPVSQNIDMDSLKIAMENQTILCARALLYQRGAGLKFNLAGFEAIMPINEIEYHIADSEIKEAAIVTRVNKKVCFVITSIDTSNTEPVVYLSRRAVQEKAYHNYIQKMVPGDILPCIVSHVDTFGVFCDIGCGLTALLPIDFISISRINKPSDRFEEGQKIYACIKSIDSKGKVVISHKELLGTWQENADLFVPFSSTVGIVRSIEKYGIFIELTPNLAGLAEVCEGIQVGDTVSIYIKSMIPDKMKVKLVIMSVLKSKQVSRDIRYFITNGHIDYWKYSTEHSAKTIQTYF